MDLVSLFNSTFSFGFSFHTTFGVGTSGGSLAASLRSGAGQTYFSQSLLALIQDGLAASKFVDLLRRQPFMGC